MGSPVAMTRSWPQWHVAIRSIPSSLETANPGSAAVEDVVAEFLHLEDRSVWAPGDRLCDMRVDDLADDDVVVALLDDAGDLALDRRRSRIEDWDPGRALVNGLARELAVF